MYVLGLVEIDNMHRIGEVFLNNPSNPAGSISQDHHFQSPFHSTLLSQGIQEATKLFCAQPSCQILDGSRLIDKHSRRQFRALTPRDAFKDRSDFELSIHIPCALAFDCFHWHTSSTHAHRDSIDLNVQAPNGDSRDCAWLHCLCLPACCWLKERLELLLFPLSQGLSHWLDHVEGLSL